MRIPARRYGNRLPNGTIARYAGSFPTLNQLGHRLPQRHREQHEPRSGRCGRRRARAPWELLVYPTITSHIRRVRKLLATRTSRRELGNLTPHRRTCPHAFEINLGCKCDSHYVQGGLDGRRCDRECCGGCHRGPRCATDQIGKAWRAVDSLVSRPRSNSGATRSPAMPQPADGRDLRLLDAWA